MKKVQQRVFELGSASATLSPTDRLLLCINGQKTNVLLQDFCESYVQYDDSIKAHSLLGEYPIVDDRIIVADNIHVSIWNKNTDEEIYFVKTKFPFIQFGDKKIDEAAFLEKIKALVPAKESFAEEIVAEIKNTEIVFEELPEEELLEEEKEEVIVNAYEEDKIKMFEEGLVEYVFDDYRLLLRTKENPKAIVLLLSPDGTYSDIKFSVVSKDLVNSSIVLQFNNSDLRGVLVGGVFSVE